MASSAVSDIHSSVFIPPAPPSPSSRTPSRSHSNSNATFGKRDDDDEHVLVVDDASTMPTTMKTESTAQYTSADSPLPAQIATTTGMSSVVAKSSVAPSSPSANGQAIPRPAKISTTIISDGEAQWGANFWVTLVEPQSQTPFYACPATGQVSWDPPVGNFVLPQSEEGEWWELSDESRGGIPYYYHTKTNETVWDRPDGFVIPLGILQNTALGRRLSLNMGSRQSIIADLQPPPESKPDAKINSAAKLNGKYGSSQSQLQRPSARRAQSSHGYDRYGYGNLTPSTLGHASGRERVGGAAAVVPKRANTADQSVLLHHQQQQHIQKHQHYSGRGQGQGQYATIGASAGANGHGRYNAGVRRAVSNEQYLSSTANGVGGNMNNNTSTSSNINSRDGKQTHVNHSSHGSGPMPLRPSLTPIPGSPYATDASVSPPSSPSRSLMSVGGSVENIKPNLNANANANAKRAEKGKGKERAVFLAGEISLQSSPRANGYGYGYGVGKGHPTTTSKYANGNGNSSDGSPSHTQRIHAAGNINTNTNIPSPRSKSSSYMSYNYNSVPPQSLDAVAELLAQQSQSQSQSHSQSSSSHSHSPAASHTSKTTPPIRIGSDKDKDNRVTSTSNANPSLPNLTPSTNTANNNNNNMNKKGIPSPPTLQIKISTTTTATSSPVTSSPSKFHTPLPSPLEISVEAKGGSKFGFVPRSASFDGRRSHNGERDGDNLGFNNSKMMGAPPPPPSPSPSFPLASRLPIVTMSTSTSVSADAQQARKKATANGVGGPAITVTDISNPVLNIEATRNLSPVKARAQGKPILLEPLQKTLEVSPNGSAVGQPSPALDTAHPVLPEDLASDIQQFVQTEFARQYFSTHRTGIIFRRKIPVEKLMTWQKAPLTHPLLVLNKSLNKDAVKIFKVIQRLMGDRERDKPIGVGIRQQNLNLNQNQSQNQQTQQHQLESYASSHLNTSQVSLPSSSLNILEEERWLLGEGITHGELRDEIYCQLIKQLTGNANSESVFRGWQLLCVLLVTFPPSKNFEAYLRGFMEQHVPITTGRLDVMAKYCIQRLAIISKKGPRGKPLAIAEIETASDAAFNPSTFGESLDAVFRLQERMYPHLQIPIILPFLADGILALGGARSEGIFRIPGDGDLISSLKLRIEKGYYNMEGIDDPHVPASLLKLWLRELCNPLIPDELYNDCISCSEDPEACVQIVTRLPTINRRVVLFIISFLQLFLDDKIQNVTKMTSVNLALVMAPNLLRCDSESMTVVFNNAQYEQTFVHNLLSYLKCNKIDPLYIPKHGLGSTIPSSSPRNSKSRNRRLPS